jgi:hypothetical protein
MRSKASRYVRVQIERLAEELDGLVLVALLVAIELRHRVEELALADGSFSHLGDRLERVDHLRPVLGRLIKRDELVQEARVDGLQLERLFERLDGLGGLLSWSFQTSAISLSIRKRSSPSTTLSRICRLYATTCFQSLSSV